MHSVSPALRRSSSAIRWSIRDVHVLFGGAIAGSTSGYLDYILPGVLVMSVLFTTVYSGIALNTDLTKGVVDRFRSLPIWKPALSSERCWATACATSSRGR
ncbi:MAG TPA: hypothetical protein VGJ70_01750 [Solirubrobacteraceae bacterium]